MFNKECLRLHRRVMFIEEQRKATLYVINHYSERKGEPVCNRTHKHVRRVNYRKQKEILNNYLNDII